MNEKRVPGDASVENRKTAEKLRLKTWLQQTGYSLQ